MFTQSDGVRAWREPITIPTYGIGQPDRNPMFLEKRVYQGSSGVVYPWPVVDRIEDETHDQTWQAIFLENAYLKIMILPELGGRVQMALDKTNDYHFVYYNRVIKPALVGLAGPWISGGIEFNWPQHHRPNTFGPVDVVIESSDDGSRTVWCHEIDRMHGTESRHGLRLHPDRAYLEIDVRLYNRTTLPQTFLWWANPAIHVDENHQSIFPPDVSAVLDHGKRDVSAFPIATGTYYKVDYSPGTDISRYRNIPVPTSYMAYKSDYDFVGSYDHGRRAGMYHVCNHHVSPGKKQWTWGTGEFGKAWARHLTDDDGPYIELMCGVFTDNQPDFSWLMPGEQKSFTQYFMPYKGVGVIGNANIHAAVGMQWARRDSQSTGQSSVIVRVYTTSDHPNANVTLSRDDEMLGEHVFDASPKGFLEHSFAVPVRCRLSELTVAVADSTGCQLVCWNPKPLECGESDESSPASTGHEIPEPAQPIDEPAKLDSVESLFLAGQHIEQYRHATRRAIDYYDEALRRDPGDIRCNHAKGRLLYRSGLFAESTRYFQRAIERLTRHNPNPIDGEAYYALGLALAKLERFDEAYAAFYKATWNAALQSAAFIELARIATRSGDQAEALRHCQRCLDADAHHHQAFHLQSYLLRDDTDASDSAAEHLRQNPFCFGVLFESALRDQNFDTYDQRCRSDDNTAIELAIDYAAFGAYDRAVAVLKHAASRRGDACSILHYHLAEYLDRVGETDEAKRHRGTAQEQTRKERSQAPFFANKLEDIAVLQAALIADPKDAVAAYHLGNLWYDRRQYDRAIECWLNSSMSDPQFATVARNLSLAYFNQRGDAVAAWESMNQAFSLNSDDARVLFELDQLAYRLGHDPRERLNRLLQHESLVERRDDLMVTRITLHNVLGEHAAALRCLQTRSFHPWEGGEGKVPAQYVTALTELAWGEIDRGNHDEAIELLQRVLEWPENLGEGKLIGTQENNVHYLLGCSHEARGETEAARQWFEQASRGHSEPSSATYYNDQPPEMILYQGLAHQRLGNADESRECFTRLVEYGNEHLDDHVKIDYFAVSLPDFLVFDADLDRSGEIHCWFMIALGRLGLGDSQAADEAFSRLLDLDPAHRGGVLHRHPVSIL